MESLAPTTTPDFNAASIQETMRRLFSEAGLDQSAAMASALAAMQAPTEFHRGWEVGVYQVSSLVCYYPMISAIQMVVCAILGLTNLLAFNLLTAVVLISLAGITALGVKHNATVYWNALSTSFWQIKDWIFASVQTTSSVTSSSTTSASIANVGSGNRATGAATAPAVANPHLQTKVPADAEDDDDLGKPVTTA